MQTFGYSQKTWQAAKNEARRVLVDRARSQTTITYTELVQRIHAIDLEAHDPRLDELLGQISTEEQSHGRGMLSVLVVHKGGDLRPGRGFYNCAASLGLDTSEERLWIEQLQLVYSTWPPA